jgi:phosphate starvation-inducible PhoH-like protein
MPTETLHFENARLAQQLFNNDPRNLQSLDEHLGVKAVARENWIKLDGDEDALEQAKELFQSLESSLKNGGTVRQREFTQALSVVKNDGISALRALFAKRIRRCHSRP